MAKIEPFPMSFTPASLAVALLAEIASDEASPHRERAESVVASWRACLATPAQVAMVETSDELEVDSEGACVSEGADPGFFIQTWTWVPTAPEEEDEEGEEADGDEQDEG